MGGAATHQRCLLGRWQTCELRHAIRRLEKKSERFLVSDEIQDCLGERWMATDVVQERQIVP